MDEKEYLTGFKAIDHMKRGIKVGELMIVGIGRNTGRSTFRLVKERPPGSEAYHIEIDPAKWTFEVPGQAESRLARKRIVKQPQRRGRWYVDPTLADLDLASIPCRLKFKHARQAKRMINKGPAVLYYRGTRIDRSNETEQA